MRLALSLVRSPLDDGDFLLMENRCLAKRGLSLQKAFALSFRQKGLVILRW